jgi:hypothetical protein
MSAELSPILEGSPILNSQSIPSSTSRFHSEFSDVLEPGVLERSAARTFFTESGEVRPVNTLDEGLQDVQVIHDALQFPNFGKHETGSHASCVLPSFQSADGTAEGTTAMNLAIPDVPRLTLTFPTPELPESLILFPQSSLARPEYVDASTSTSDICASSSVHHKACPAISSPPSLPGHDQCGVDKRNVLDHGSVCEDRSWCQSGGDDQAWRIKRQGINSEATGTNGQQVTEKSEHPVKDDCGLEVDENNGALPERPCVSPSKTISNAEGSTIDTLSNGQVNGTHGAIRDFKMRTKRRANFSMKRMGTTGGSIWRKLAKVFLFARFGKREKKGSTEITLEQGTTTDIYSVQDRVLGPSASGATRGIHQNCTRHQSNDDLSPPPAFPDASSHFSRRSAFVTDDR